jgi:hypothetical protein
MFKKLLKETNKIATIAESDSNKVWIENRIELCKNRLAGLEGTKLFGGEKDKFQAEINRLELKLNQMKEKKVVEVVSISKLADEFENRRFEYELEQFNEEKCLKISERIMLMQELMRRQDIAFETIKEQELKPEVQAIVMELVEVQKKLNALKAKIEELKATKTDMSQPVIDALNELNLQSIRVGKVLVSLYQGKTAASFKAVIEAIETQLTPAVAKLLRDTYEKLSVKREPEVRIKVESVKESNIEVGDTVTITGTDLYDGRTGQVEWAEGYKVKVVFDDGKKPIMNLFDLDQVMKESVKEDLLTGIADFFSNMFRKLLGGVSNALTKIENLLGGAVKEEEIDPHKIEKNKPGPVVFGLG